MADGDTKATDTVTTTVVDGSNSASVNLSLAEGKDTAANTGPSAESLGVSPEQFDKFFDAKEGAYNWQAHAKEAEFKTEQKSKAADGEGEGKETAPSSDDEAKTLAERAGLDFTALQDKVIDDGDLEAADYAALKAIGLPEDVVKDYIAGIHERVETHVKNVYAAFGGETNFEAVRTSIADQYSKDELAALSTRLSDPNEYKLTADMLLAKAGKPPVERGTAVNGPNAGAPGTSESKPFASQMEMVRMQRDPRYKTDAAFRSEVYKRAAVSDFSVNPRGHTSGL